MGLAQNIVELAAAHHQSFVRSGGVYRDNGVLWGSGLGGYIWSSRVLPDGKLVHSFDFGVNNIGPSATYNRWGGFPLRCLVR